MNDASPSAPPGKIEDKVKSAPLLEAALRPFARVIRGLTRRANERAVRLFRNSCLALSQMDPPPVFVKVGANDGVTGDPCSDILLGNPRWKGLLIEPVPYCFERLKANFGDATRFALEQVAIGKPGKAPFYFLDPGVATAVAGLPYYFDQLGSFDPGHITRHLGEAVRPFIREGEVDVCALSDVVDRNGIGSIQLLHIDVEGHDYEVLKTLDFARHVPTLIFLEHKHLARTDRHEMLDMLRCHGYRVHDCGSDYFAINKARYARDRSRVGPSHDGLGRTQST